MYARGLNPRCSVSNSMLSSVLGMSSSRAGAAALAVEDALSLDAALDEAADDVRGLLKDVEARDGPANSDSGCC